MALAQASGRDSEQVTDSDIDQAVGRRLRVRRVELGMSQTAVADGIGVTFQQVQKYERAANRMSASRLLDLAELLKVPIEYFFEELEIVDPSEPARISINKTIGELVEHYYKIDRSCRVRLSALIGDAARFSISQ